MQMDQHEPEFTSPSKHQVPFEAKSYMNRWPLKYMDPCGLGAIKAGLRRVELFNILFFISPS